jgi:hypothetical protein
MLRITLQKIIISRQAHGTQLNVSQVDVSNLPECFISSHAIEQTNHDAFDLIYMIMSKGTTDFRFCRERVFLADVESDVRNVSLMCFIDDVSDVSSSTCDRPTSFCVFAWTFTFDCNSFICLDSRWKHSSLHNSR